MNNTTSLTKLHNEMVAVTEERDRLAAELTKLREQELVAMISQNDAGQISIKNHDGTFFDMSKHVGCQLYVAPVPAVAAPAVPALSVPDGDDFNGTTPHLIQCMEALVRLDADGVLVPHGIGRSASRLLSTAANRLRKQTAPSVPEEWLESVSELLTHIEDVVGDELWQKICATKWNNVSALLQSTGEKK